MYISTNKSKNAPVVWQLSALHLNRGRTLFNGVILKNAPYDFNRETSVLSNLAGIIRSYFTTTYSNQSITIRSGDKTAETLTNKHGGFRIITDWQHKGETEILLQGSEVSLKIAQNYPVVQEYTNNEIGIISDIDDTIIVSFTSSFFKRIGTLIFKSPRKRRPIEYSQKVFGELGRQKARIFYVSKSESNLFGALSTFISHNSLPGGSLFLTPYLGFTQLLNPKKGVDFKIRNIRFLLENRNEKSYILFGDDSQKDIEIYNEICREFPGRILKIFIRQIRANIRPSRKQMMEKLLTCGVPVKYFKADESIEEINELINLKA